MAKEKDPNAPGSIPPNENGNKHALRRREFVKLVGGTGVAATAQVLAGRQLATAATTTVPDEAVGSGKVIGPGPVPMTLRINGEAKRVTLEPRVTLLDALRNHLDLTGAKKVCDRGTCGACTVIVKWPTAMENRERRFARSKVWLRKASCTLFRRRLLKTMRNSAASAPRVSSCLVRRILRRTTIPRLKK